MTGRGRWGAARCGIFHDATITKGLLSRRIRVLQSGLHPRTSFQGDYNNAILISGPSVCIPIRGHFRFIIRYRDSGQGR